jgi:hypothetical protein
MTTETTTTENPPQETPTAFEEGDSGESTVPASQEIRQGLRDRWGEGAALGGSVPLILFLGGSPHVRSDHVRSWGIAVIGGFLSEPARTRLTLNRHRSRKMRRLAWRRWNDGLPFPKQFKLLSALTKELTAQGQ